MAKAPAFQFYMGDWLRDGGVQSATWETRGLWTEMLLRMWDAPERGKLEYTEEQYCRLIGCTCPEFVRALSEICLLKIGEVSQNGHGVISITNRRMRREQIERENAAERKRQERERKSESRSCHKDDTEKSRSLSSSSSSSSCPKGHNTSSEPEPSDTAFSEGDDPYDLALDLIDYITDNNPSAKVPTTKAQFQKWALTFDRMIRLDHRHPDDIGRVMKWCQTDDFWRANILSPDKLRKQYDQLYLKSRNNG